MREKSGCKRGVRRLFVILPSLYARGAEEGFWLWAAMTCRPMADEGVGSTGPGKSGGIWSAGADGLGGMEQIRGCVFDQILLAKLAQRGFNGWW